MRGVVSETGKKAANLASGVGGKFTHLRSTFYTVRDRLKRSVHGRIATLSQANRKLDNALTARTRTIHNAWSE